ncbi:c-type cytochrome biogenesis protein CcsB, partial [Paraburkholderia dipogonis]
MNLIRPSLDAGAPDPAPVFQWDVSTTAAQTLAPFDERPFLKRLGIVDWLFAVVMVAGAGFALSRYHPFMNYYDKLVLCLAVPVFVVLGWRWKPVRPLMVGIAALSLLAIQIYHGDLTRADNAFFLKYFLSSQSAILWMSA